MVVMGSTNRDGQSQRQNIPEQILGYPAPGEESPLSKWALLNKQAKNNSAFRVMGSQLELAENSPPVTCKYHTYAHVVGKENLI